MPVRSSRRRALCGRRLPGSTWRGSASTLALRGALALGLALPAPMLATGPATAKGIDSLADLAASVTDAVVNISAAQVTEEHGPATVPKLPPGTPLDQLFEDFFQAAASTP